MKRFMGYIENVSAPAVPVIAAVQEDLDYGIEVTWAECVGAFSYEVTAVKGAETIVTVVDAAHNTSGIETADYAIGEEVSVTVKSVGANNMPSAASDPAVVTIATIDVDAVTLTIVPPVEGVVAAISSIGADARYEVTDTAWKTAADVALAIGDPFEGATVYKALITLTAKNIREFVAGFDATNITAPATSVLSDVAIDPTNKICTFTLTYPATAAKEIAAASFGVTAPVKAENAAVATVSPEDDYTMTSSVWKNAGDVVLAAGQPFLAATVYKVLIRLTAKATALFADAFAVTDVAIPATAAITGFVLGAGKDTIDFVLTYPATAA